MRIHPFIAAGLLAFAGSARATPADICRFESDYDLRVEPQSLVFHRASGTPKHVEMKRGQLFVDRREVRLSAEDTRRIEHIESEVRALVPQVRALALDAVTVAGQAVSQVALSFAGDDSESVVQRIDALTGALEQRIAASNDTADWNNGAFEDAVESLVSEVVPLIAGDIASLAIRAALTGDEAAARKIEARAEEMERAIEQNVERRAKSLEARAEALCPRVQALDELEDALAVELDLLQAKRGE